MSPAAARPAGYSGTPLAQKLGFKAQMTVHSVDAPRDYREWLDGLDPGVDFSTLALRKILELAGFAWISWPKKSAKIETDITEDTIREVALPLGFVDVKVYAVTNVWSGLKRVIRKGERR